MAVWQVILEDAANEKHAGVCTKMEDFIAATLDIPDDGQVEGALQGLESAGLISVGMGAITILRWSEYQYEQDVRDPTGSERQRRWRARAKENLGQSPVTVTERNGSETVMRRPDTDTETDTERSSLRSDLSSLRSDRSSLRSESPVLQTGPSAEENLQPKKSRARKAPTYSPDFESRFWQPYPRTPIMSKAEAWAVWVDLSPEDRELSIRAIEPYKAFLASKPDHPVVHANRFLSKRRFDGFAEASQAPKNQKPSSPMIPFSKDEKAFELVRERFYSQFGRDLSPAEEPGYFLAPKDMIDVAVHHTNLLERISHHA
jgi:hypothetical protein